MEEMIDKNGITELGNRIDRKHRNRKHERNKDRNIKIREGEKFKINRITKTRERNSIDRNWRTLSPKNIICSLGCVFPLTETNQSQS